MPDDRNLILDQEKRLVASALLGGAAVARKLLTEVHPEEPPPREWLVDGWPARRRACAAHRPRLRGQGACPPDRRRPRLRPRAPAERGRVAAGWPGRLS